jgi:hypothetical protein
LISSASKIWEKIDQARQQRHFQPQAPLLLPPGHNRNGHRNQHTYHRQAKFAHQRQGIQPA